MEIGVYDIIFKPQTMIRAQALSDFVAKWIEAQIPAESSELEYWMIHFNGSLQLTGAGAGISVTSPRGEQFKYVLQIHFVASHNVVEYEALLHGIRIAIALDIHRLKIVGDSLLVINQVSKEWICSNEKMAAYCQEVRKLEDKFDGLEFTHILRGRNKAADELAKLGCNRSLVPPEVLLQELHEPTIQKKKAKTAAPSIDVQSTNNNDDPKSVAVMMITSDWRAPFIRYLADRSLPEDKVE